MRELRILFSATLVLVAATTGCSQNTEQLAESAGDSLLSASPVETPEGSLTPSQDYQQPPTPQQNPPVPAARRPASTRRSANPAPPAEPVYRGVTVPAGTALNVSVSANITSETAQAGEAWQGTVTQPIIIGTDAPIPAGSTVRGVVRAAKPAEKGDRAMLQLAVTSVVVNGKTHAVSASTEQMIAGSTRTRNVGAVAGATAAGALIGKAVGGSTKGALIGGLVGGAASAGAVAKSKGYQVVVKEGAELIFVTDQTVTMR
ncbi:MAG: hypothetical protein ABIS67_10955 [Candidatus Eisenbacteria bacterium]